MIARVSVVINTLRKKLSWMVSAVIIFSLNYSSSYAALLWQPASPKVDTRSALTADYRPWSFLTFQPLDPAIIKEIQQERKLPDQLVVPGTFWPTAEVQPSETTMPAEVTESPVASASPLSPTPVTTLPRSVVTATPTQASKPPVPTRPPDPISSPTESPQKKPHPDHPDHPDHPNQ